MTEVCNYIFIVLCEPTVHESSSENTLTGYMVRQAQDDTQVVILSLSKDAPIFISLCERPAHGGSLYDKKEL